MRGLKQPDSIKFERFFQLVQNEAKKNNKVFFLQNGEGRELFTEDLEAEDLFGWLIPAEEADQFESVWKSGRADGTRVDNMAFAVWNQTGGDVTVQFKMF